MGAGGERAGAVAPGPRPVGGDAAQERGAVIDLDRAVCFRGSGERHGIHIGDAVADRTAIRRERGNRRGDRGGGVDGDAQGGGSCAGVAGDVGGGGSQAVRAIAKRGGGVVPGPRPVCGHAAEQGCPIKDFDRAVGFRGAGERQGSVVGDAVANRAAVGRVGRNRRGNRGRGVDGDVKRGRGNAGIAGGIGGRRREAVRAIGERGGGIAPGAGAAGNDAAQERYAVIDLDRRVGFRRAGQRQRVVVGHAVANGAAIRRVGRDRRSNRGNRVNRYVQRHRCRTVVAGGIGGRGGEAVRAIAKRSGGVVPGPCSVRGDAAEQRCTIKDLYGCVGRRGAGERQRVVIGNAIANGAAVGRIRRNNRSCERR